MFTEAKKSALAPYADAVDGPVDAAVCIVFGEELGDEGHAALSAACAGIGFADPVFLDARSACIAPAGAKGEGPDEAASEPDAASHMRQTHKNLFAAIEALDPLMLVAADDAAASLLAAAYREPLVVASHGFVFGRPYAAFSSFRRDLADPRMKQRNWALFKAMRKSAHWLE